MTLNRLAADFLRDRESIEADRNRVCVLCHGPLDLEESDKTGLAHDECSRLELIACGIDPDADFRAWVNSMEEHAQGIDSDYEAWAADQHPGQECEF